MEATASQGQRLRRQLRWQGEALILLLPAYALFLLFLVLPLLEALWLSLHQVELCQYLPSMVPNPGRVRGA